jgi:flagellar biogenesis protein FliO
VISRRTSSLAAFFFLCQCAAWGQTALPSPMASPSPFLAPFPSHTGDSVQIAVYFILIIALLAAGLYYTRTGFSGLNGKGKGERKLVVTETRTLGNRQFLVVAEYENRKMLLGVCPGRIDYLSTLSEGNDDTFSTDLQDKAE